MGWIIGVFASEITCPTTGDDEHLCLIDSGACTHGCPCGMASHGVSASECSCEFAELTWKCLKKRGTRYGCSFVSLG